MLSPTNGGRGEQLMTPSVIPEPISRGLGHGMHPDGERTGRSRAALRDFVASPDMRRQCLY
jgi:hypothetical protein